MEEFHQQLGVIDLISEKHKQLRYSIQNSINQGLENHFSEMDIYLITLIHFSPMSISEAARNMGITRQGAHKHAKRLIELEYLQAESCQNRRDKELRLTPKGLTLHSDIMQIKSSYEGQIVQALGQENFTTLMRFLQMPW